MPRCYMVKKYYQPLSRSPPCSPPEACVAPPCYYPHVDHSTQTDRGRKGGDRREGKKKAESGGNWFKTPYADSDDDGLTDSELEDRGRKGGDRREGKKKAESGGNWFKTPYADSDDDGLTDSELEGYGKKMEKTENMDMGGKNVYGDENTNYGLILDMSLNVVDDDDSTDRLIVDESKIIYEDDETRDGLVVDENKDLEDEDTCDYIASDDTKNIDEDARDGFTMYEVKKVFAKEVATQENFTTKNYNNFHNNEEYRGIMVEEGNKIDENEKKQDRSIINESQNKKKIFNDDVSGSSYEGLMIDESNKFDDDDELDFGLTVIEGQNVNEDVEIDLGLRVKACDEMGEGEKLNEVVHAENPLANSNDVQSTVQGEKVVEGENVEIAEHDCRGDGGSVKYADLGATPLSERSAADTEAAHELLSLAAGVPPLPPAALVTMLDPEPQPMIPVPLYTYAIPTNIYILAEESPEPIYHTVQTVSPMPQVNYAAIDPQGNYITYQEAPVPCAAVPMDYQPMYRECIPQPVVMQPVVMEPIAVPVSVIEPTPMVHPVSLVDPVSVQVPVIEMVPQVHQHLTQPAPVLDQAPPSPEQNVPEERKRRTRVENAGKFDCNECGKRYATSSNLSRHKQTHRSLDSVSAKRCGECGKAYVSMPALAMHVLTHRMGHVCGVCGKQFSRPWLLRGHLRSHTGEKPYRCLSCNKAFADRSNLRAHLQTHSADKKFECHRCNKNFALKSYLSKHQESACVREDDL